MAISFWNVSKNESIGPWPLIFLVLSIISTTLFYMVYSRATNAKLIEEEIKSQVSKARTKIIEELNKDKETEEEVDTDQEIETAVSKIVPKGKFKTADSFIKKLFSNLANEFQIVCGIYYSLNKQKKVFSMQTRYALQDDVKLPEFKLGETLNGQAAENKEIMIVSEIPEDYFTIESGLGNAKPKHIIIIPFIGDKKTIAVLEFATFIEIPSNATEILTRVATLLEEKLKQL
jgi:transcriptional regulator with GAF, ATPase, and Fis domain